MEYQRNTERESLERTHFHFPMSGGVDREVLEELVRFLKKNHVGKKE